MVAPRTYVKGVDELFDGKSENWKPIIPVKGLNSLIESGVHQDKDIRKELLRIDGRLLGRKVSILVDGGAQSNFVSKAFVQHIHGKTSTVKGQQTVAVLPDGRTYRLDQVLKGGKLSVPGGYTEILDLTILPMNYDVILGKPWLAKYNPQIDWRTNIIKFERNGKLLVWNAIKWKDQPENIVTALQLKKLSRSEELYLLWVKETVNRNIDKIEVREAILEEYCDVFPESLPQKLPPRRTVDHRIELETNYTPPSRPIYRVMV